MKRVAILQSNYIPWKGYIDLIASVDTFILYDDAQYTKRDWRNRNKIKTPKGSEWLTIPVEVKGKYSQRINEVLIADPSWPKKHWSIIAQHYRKAPYFSEVSEWLGPLYCDNKEFSLSKINKLFLTQICILLEIETQIVSSSDFDLIEGKTDRLVDLCIKVNADKYVSGPSAKAYIEESKFTDAGVSLSWFDYLNYSQYPQLFGEFEHSVTILDLLFNVGPDAHKYMKFVK